jgi:glycosyltransferase involved in cell wall biosynthesis
MADGKESYLFIRKGHVLKIFAQSLCVADRSVQLVEYNGFSDLHASVKRIEGRARVMFYVPDWFLLPLVIIFYCRHSFFYFLHEPVITPARSPSMRFFLFYKMWLWCLRRFVSLIFLSAYGAKLGRTPNADPIIMPLLFDPGMAFENAVLQEEKKVDVIMWGSLNREKGLDRFLEVAAANESISFGVLARRTDQLELQRQAAISIGNVHWDLRDQYVPDQEIFRFVQSGRIAFLCQRESTQSAQLPLALALAVPVVASDCGSFPEFIGDGLYSSCVPNNLAGDELVGCLTEHIAEILGNYPKASQEASKMFDDKFKARTAIFENWSLRLRL